jgi:simple sugar transport system ATP-binding protein
VKIALVHPHSPALSTSVISMSNELLQLSNISKSFGGVRALQDVSLSIERSKIYTLVGENGCGKSTLIKIIAGVYSADSGTIRINDKAHQTYRPIDAIRAGIQVIYQDFSLFPNLSVAENIALNEELADGKRVVNWGRVRSVAAEALGQIGVHMNLGAPVEEMGVANKQLIAISKALRQKARLIVMDEPTSALTEREVRNLFEVIHRLHQQGIAFLFVSHKLDEVLEISEQVIVMRNGRKVSEGPVGDYDQKRLVLEMTGLEIGKRTFSYTPASNQAPVIQVSGLTAKGAFEDVSFVVYPGEIVGVTGLLGSGRTEVALALFGMLPTSGGSIAVDGQGVRIRSIQDAIGHGIGYVPEDRVTEGLFLEQTIGRNIVVRVMDRLRNGLRLTDRKQVEGEIDEWVKALRIKTNDPGLAVRTLSGGNQQRVVLAKWLASRPKLLVLNGPTMGVDVGSKNEIHEIMKQLAQQGMGLIVISDDIPELLQTCNRILLMRRGRIVDEILPAQSSENELAARLVED